MCLRALAYVLAWPFLIPRIVGALDRALPALNTAPPAPGHVLPISELLVAEIVILCIAALLTAVLLLTERFGGKLGTLSDFATRTNLAGGPGWAVPLASGAVLGSAVFTMMMGALLAAGAYQMSFSAAGAAAKLAELGKFALLFAAIGLTEEFMYRAYLQKALQDIAGFWPATLLTSALFGLSHAAGIDTPAGAASTVLFAIFACLTLRATGNLWFAIGWHAGWDFTKTAIFGTPNGGVHLATGLAHTSGAGPIWLTGGAAGPEASIACFLVDTMLVIMLLRSPSIILRGRATSP